MRSNLLLAALLFSQTVPNSAQTHFVSQDQSHFFEWFHERSQVVDLYADRTTLYTFTDEATVKQRPSENAGTVTQLPIGWTLTNIAYSENYVPKDEINGYEDLWYHVQGIDQQGKPFNGYIWGAQVAKGWRATDITGDGINEFIMLGIAAKTRQKPSDINAEIRILQCNRMISQTIVPKLCVFEECASSPMLRVLQSQQIEGLTVIEASTMTIGCSTGIDKAFYYWNGSGLERVYQAEYVTQTEMFKKQFIVAPAGSKSTTVQVCAYRGEDSNYNPIWKCEEKNIETAQQPKAVAVAFNATTGGK